MPDVAFLADPHPGVAVAYKGGWRRFGGTSLGAPCWAALWAIARQYDPALAAGSGGANPLLYAAGRGPAGSRAYHDITQGSNGTYSARRGWDFVTGWGTPDAAELLAALARLTAKGP
jgi:kumamolisin